MRVLSFKPQRLTTTGKIATRIVPTNTGKGKGTSPDIYADVVAAEITAVQI